MAVTVGARRGEAPSGLLAVGEEVTYTVQLYDSILYFSLEASTRQEFLLVDLCMRSK
jgi:hypothetical protein